jgi:hypothetical protein
LAGEPGLLRANDYRHYTASYSTTHKYRHPQGHPSRGYALYFPVAPHTCTTLILIGNRNTGCTTRRGSHNLTSDSSSAFLSSNSSLSTSDARREATIAETKIYDEAQSPVRTSQSIFVMQVFDSSQGELRRAMRGKSSKSDTARTRFSQPGG